MRVKYNEQQQDAKLQFQRARSRAILQHQEVEFKRNVSQMITMIKLGTPCSPSH